MPDRERERGFLDRISSRMAARDRAPLLHHYRSAGDRAAISGADLADTLGGYVLRLQEHCAPGDIVFIISDDPLKQVLWWLAALYAGLTPGILTPLTPKLDKARYFKSLEATLAAYGQVRLVYDGAPGDDRYTGVLPPDRLVAADVAPAPLRDPGRRPDGVPLVFQQSSGTTGPRKGILLSERAVVRQLDALGAAIALRDDDVIVSWLPLYHDMGLVGCLLQAVYTATPLVLTSPFVWLERPEWLFEAIHRHQGTLCWLPNFAFTLLADRVKAAARPPDMLASLRLVTSCSEPVTASALERFGDAFAAIGFRPEALSSSYALAENTFAATQSRPGRGVRIETVDRSLLESGMVAVPAADGVRQASSGETLANTRARVRRDGVIRGEGEVGDIELRSDCLLEGYFGIGADIPAFTDDGWYRTGDYGYIRDGQCFVIGRRNDVIIRAGRNIHPADLEGELDGLPGLKPGRVAAFGVFNPHEETEDVVVVAEFAADRVNDLDAIARAVRARLAERFDLAPQRVEIVRPNWLVKSSSGKISRAGCREKYAGMCRRRRIPEFVSHEYAENIDEEVKDAFRTFGAESRLRTPAMVLAPERISIGNWVGLGRHGRLQMQTDFSRSVAMIRQHYPDVEMEFDPHVFGPRDPWLKIGDGTSIGDHFIISCANRIEIGTHVLISDRVFIADSNHLYGHPDLPIALQSNSLGKPILIEDHAWIGVNVVIFEGVRIGRHAIVSAGSVVTGDVPPFSVVAGNPARVVKMILDEERPAPPATPARSEEGGATPSGDGLMMALTVHLEKEIGRPVAAGESLFRASTVDSLGTLRLLLYIEEITGVHVDFSELLADKIDDMEGLVRYVSARRAGGASGRGSES